MSRNLRVAVLGPMSLDLLPLRAGTQLPSGYPAPIISDLVAGLLEAGHEVVAISSSHDLGTTWTAKSGRLTTIVVPRGRARQAYALFAQDRIALARVLRAARVDVAHAHWSYEFAAAALDARVPTLVTVHDHAATVFRMNPTAYRAMRCVLNSRVMQRGRFFTVPSAYLKGTLPDWMDGRVRVVPDFYGNIVESVAAEAVTGEPAVVTVANGFGERKNLRKALEAWAAARESLPGWEYRVLGDEMGTEGPAHAWAVRHQLAAGVRFMGPLKYESALRAIARCSVMLHPSREESFGMSVLESMALGVGVIGGVRAGNIPALLSGGAGFLCDVEDVRQMALAMGRMAEDEQLRQAVSLQARKKAATEYTRLVAVARFERLYVDVMAKSRRPRRGA